MGVPSVHRPRACPAAGPEPALDALGLGRTSRALRAASADSARTRGESQHFSGIRGSFHLLSDIFTAHIQVQLLEKKSNAP